MLPSSSIALGQACRSSRMAATAMSCPSTRSWDSKRLPRMNSVEVPRTGTAFGVPFAGMGKRDDEHAMEHFAAARDMLRYESDRLSNIFSAFLLANTVLIGFVLHATSSGEGFPGEPSTALVGGLVGLCVAGLWLAAYERIASLLEMRMARARETEPDGWELLTGRPHSFNQGHAEVFEGEDEPRRVTGLARLEIRNAARLLIALFIVAYATVAVWGFVDTVK
jgi:hypothetical protein